VNSDGLEGPRCLLNNVDLISVPADYGRGANDGAYYPVGLLTIGSHFRRKVPDVKISVIDLQHEPHFQPRADVVGISASSTLNYRKVLSVAQQAKAAGAIVVLGGPHVTRLSTQVLNNRIGLIDYVVRGNGDSAFASLFEALQSGSDLHCVPNLSWRGPQGEIIHNSEFGVSWKYDDFLPLDLSLLRAGVKSYWNTFRTRIDPTIDAAFVVFSHFGCGYREMMQQRTGNGKQLSRWCSYCSLNDPLSNRSGDAIVSEVLGLIRSNGVPRKSNVLLKCYGDNVGTQQAMLRSLASAIERSEEWAQYNIGWTFYSQSSRVTPELVNLLCRVGARNLYIGFDSVDDRIQLLNGLGTSASTHQRAARLCYERGIKIQAGFVLGNAGETTESVEKSLRFAEALTTQGGLERINSAIIFIIPGSPAYSLLCKQEPWIESLDELPTEELQWQWIRHFCPDLGQSPSEGLAILKQAANKLNQLLEFSPQASMGFISNRLAAEVSQQNVFDK